MTSEKSNSVRIRDGVVQTDASVRQNYRLRRGFGAVLLFVLSPRGEHVYASKPKETINKLAMAAAIIITAFLSESDSAPPL